MTDETLDQTHANEQATLGACLLNPQVLTDITAKLEAKHFANPRHRDVWDAIQALRTDRQPVDPVTVATRMATTGTLGRLDGGAAYLHTLTDAVPVVLSCEHYAGKVLEAWIRRELAVITTRTSRQALEADDPHDLIATTQRQLASLATGNAADSCVTFGSIAPTALDRIEEAGQAPGGPVGLPTGFADLDTILHGYQNGRLHLIGALSGAGKSVLLGDAFRAWMRCKIPSVLITLEMGREEVWRRQASAACRIPHHAINTGKLEDHDWSKLAGWIADTADAPSWICDKPKMTIAEIDALIMRGVETHGWRGAIVDYAQIIRHNAPTRERAVAEIAAGLKEIARKANIPVLAGAQLNRESTKRPGGAPRLSDLRESAALEHEADVAVLIHRPDYDDEESPRAGEADLIVAKNRGGAKGTVTVCSQMHFQRFADMSI